MAKVTKKRWRPSMKAYRSKERLVAMQQVALDNARADRAALVKVNADHRREAMELQNRIRDLETQNKRQFVYLEDLTRARSWRARFARLFGFGQ